MILLPLSEDDRMDADEHDITSFLHLQRLLDIQRQNAASEKLPGKFHNNAGRTLISQFCYIRISENFGMTHCRPNKPDFEDSAVHS